MRLGKVIFKIEYVVDLDNNHMVAQCYDWIIYDVQEAVKYNDILGYVTEHPDTTGTLTYRDIPSALTNEENKDRIL